jgi:hypothetical protein
MRDVCVCVCVCLYAHTYWHTDMRVYLHMQVRNMYVCLIFMSTCRWKRLCRFELMRFLSRFTKYYVFQERFFSRRRQLQKLHTAGDRWMRMAYWWNTDRKNGSQRRKPVHCHFDCHKSNMDWRGWKTGVSGVTGWLPIPEAWHSRNTRIIFEDDKCYFLTSPSYESECRHRNLTKMCINFPNLCEFEWENNWETMEVFGQSVSQPEFEMGKSETLLLGLS